MFVHRLLWGRRLSYPIEGLNSIRLAYILVNGTYMVLMCLFDDLANVLVVLATPWLCPFQEKTHLIEGGLLSLALGLAISS